MLIRPAEPVDALAVARVHVRSWQAGYKGLMPQEYLDGLRPEDRAARYTFGSDDPAAFATLVGEVGGGIRGFASTRAAGEPGAAADGEGLVCALYVDPDWWGTGLGRALIAAARAALAAWGCTRAVLWVLAGNERAQRFYAADGWVDDGVEREDLVWGARVDERRFSRSLL